MMRFRCRWRTDTSVCLKATRHARPFLPALRFWAALKRCAPQTRLDVVRPCTISDERSCKVRAAARRGAYKRRLWAPPDAPAWLLSWTRSCRCGSARAAPATAAALRCLAAAGAARPPPAWSALGSGLCAAPPRESRPSHATAPTASDILTADDARARDTTLVRGLLCCFTCHARTLHRGVFVQRLMLLFVWRLRHARPLLSRRPAAAARDHTRPAPPQGRPRR
jgi:hypothetical protein